MTSIFNTYQTVDGEKVYAAQYISILYHVDAAIAGEMLSLGVKPDAIDIAMRDIRQYQWVLVDHATGAVSTYDSTVFKQCFRRVTTPPTSILPPAVEKDDVTLAKDATVLRDDFAKAYLSSRDWPINRTDWSTDRAPLPVSANDLIARECYAVADAMMVARNSGSKK